MSISILTVNQSQPSESPFDSIRHFDRNGIEFWKARELMKMLGYAKWQKFEMVIEVAIENLESAIVDITEHLTPSGKLPTASDPVPLQDYKLSRIACYHVALACDSRGKPEVKAAKHYFATKTREAEVLVPAISERLELARLENDSLKRQLELIDRRETIYKLQPKAIADRLTGVTEVSTIEIRTKIVDEAGFILNAGKTVSKTELAGRYGFVSKTGKADTKLVTTLINEAIEAGAIPNPWRDVRVVASAGFDAELVPILDKFFDANPIQRQRWIGEN